MVGIYFYFTQLTVECKPLNLLYRLLCIHYNNNLLIATYNSYSKAVCLGNIVCMRWGPKHGVWPKHTNYRPFIESYEQFHHHSLESYVTSILLVGVSTYRTLLYKKVLIII